MSFSPFFTAWAIFGLVIALALVLNQLYLWWKRRSYPPIWPAPSGYLVTIENGGRTGTLTYQEDDHEVRLGWELGGRDVVVYVQTWDEDEWPAHVRWAAARRSEILERIAGEVHRQKCRTCRWEIGSRWIEFREEQNRP